MKPKIKLEKINFKKIGTRSDVSNFLWQKIIFWVAAIVVAIFLCASSYLIFRPLDQNIQAIIDKEIQSIKIIFDQKTLQELRSKKQPTKATENQSVKNPFLSF